MGQIHGLAWRHLFGLATILAAACVAPEVGSICPPAAYLGGPAPCACLGRDGSGGELFYDVSARRPLDVLLVVGNTPGMAEKQRTLAMLKDWSWLLNSQYFSLHLGVVSTDVGSWVAEGTPFAQPAGACDSFAGDDGVMQVTPCLDRTGQTPAAQAACAAVCPDRRHIITDGRRFITTAFGQSNVAPAMEVDARTGRSYDRGPEYALRCLVPLGESGCTISSPLEAAKRALDGHRRENTGFRRPDAPLIILFVSDRDDCSMQLSRRAENDPATLRCDTPDRGASPRCFAPGPYRCLAADRVCDQPWNQSGEKSYCTQRPDSPLVPVEDYLRFFQATAQGSWWQYTNALTSAPAVGQGAQILALQPAGSTEVAALTLAPACQSPTDPRLFGLPQHRLSAIRAPWIDARGELPRLAPPSICDPSQYSELLPPLFIQLLYRGSECLPGKAKRSANGQPLCLVGPVPYDQPKSLPDRLWPTCGARCCAGFANSSTGKAEDPTVIAACSGESEPCYCVESSQQQVCRTAWESGEVLGVWVPLAATPPSGTGLSIRCALVRECSP